MKIFLSGSTLAAHIQKEVTTLAMLWKITRKDGTVQGFTDHDVALSWDGVTYEATLGFDSSNIQSRGDMSVDTIEAEGIIDSTSLDAADLNAGLYDNAQVDIYIANYKVDLDADPPLQLRQGIMGEVSQKNGKYTAELRSKSQYLQNTIGELYSPACRANFGDHRCKVSFDPSPDPWATTTAYTALSEDVAGDTVTPIGGDGFWYQCMGGGTSGAVEPAWPGVLGRRFTDDDGLEWECMSIQAVQIVLTGQTVTFASPTEPKGSFAIALVQADPDYPDGWFDSGIVAWESGANIGLSGEIKTYTVDGFGLIFTMPDDIATGNTCALIAGCDKTLETCRDRYGNTINFRGEPYIPSRDQLTQTPEGGTVEE